MKKIILLLFVLCFITGFVDAQVIYGDKYFEKTGSIFSFTNEAPRGSWDFDCNCGNSCTKTYTKYYNATNPSQVGLHTQNVVTQFSRIQLFQVDAAQSVDGVYDWTHSGRKYGAGSFFCTACECFVEDLQPFKITICDFTWKSEVSTLDKICKDNANQIDLKTYLNYYDNVVSITGPGVNSSGILNVSTLAAGTYTITALRGFDNTSGSKSISFSFTVVDFSVSISAPTTTACAGSPITLTGTVTGNSTGGTYTWYKDAVVIAGANNQTYSANQTGVYKFDYTVFGCTKTSANVGITINPLPNATTNPSGNVFLCTGQSLTINATPGASTYAWSNSATSSSIVVNTTGSYTVTVSNSFGCFATSPSINVIAAGNNAATISASNGLSICSGETTTLSTISGDSYKWYFNSVLTSVTTQDYVANAAGLYRVEVTTGSCVSSSPSVTVSIKPSAVPTISSSGQSPICQNDIFTLTSSPASQYAWSNGQNTSMISPTSSGSYFVSVTYANGCVRSSSAFDLVVKANPKPVITPQGSTTFCQGQASLQLTSSSTSGTYQWYNNGVAISGMVFSSITVNSSGSYTVATFNNGCSALSDPIVVTAAPKPIVVISQSGISCNSSPVTLTANSVPSQSNGLDFLWSTGAVTQSINVNTPGSYTCRITNALGCFGTATYVLSSTSLVPPTITASGPTVFCNGGRVFLTSSYATGNVWSTGETAQTIEVSAASIITVTTNNGTCSATSNSVTIIVYPKPTASITASGPTSFCQGGIAPVLTANDNVSYLWSPTNETTKNITPNANASATYTVTTTNEFGCSTTSASVQINVSSNPRPVISVIGGTNICEGSFTILTANGGLGNYLWSNGSQSQSITVTNSGDYSVSSSSGGCSSTSDVIRIIVKPAIDASITANGPLDICSGLSVQLTASFADGWVWNTGATTRTINVNSSGNYFVDVYKDNCVKRSSVTVVTVRNAPTASIIGGDGTQCSGSNVTLTANTNAQMPNIIWSNGVTGSSIVVNTPGNYYYTVTDVYGCSSVSAPKNITFGSIPPPTIFAASATTFCPGGSVLLSAPSGYSYKWLPSLETTRSITVSSSSNVTVTIFDPNGCSATSAVKNVVVHPAESPTITVNGSTTICDGETVQLTSSSAAGYTWLPNGGSNASIFVSAAGTYRVQTTSVNGCIGTSSPVTISVRPGFVPTISAPQGAIACEGENIILRSVSGVSYLWSNGATTQNIVVTSGTSYSVTTQSSDGCFGTSAPFAVTFKPNPRPTITPSRLPFICANPPLTVSSSSAISYLWSNSATTPTITVSNTGNYYVTVVNPNGCSSRSDTLEVNQGIVIPVAPITQKKLCVNAPALSLTYGSPIGGYYTGPGVANQNEFTPSVAGIGTHTLSYNVVSASGCISSVNFIMEVKPKIIWSPLADTSVCIGSNLLNLRSGSMPSSPGSVFFTGTGVVGEYFNPAAAGLGTFIVSIRVNDSIGCEEIKTMKIIVFDNPTKPIIVGARSACIGDTLNLSASSFNANSYQWFVLGNPVPFATTQTIRFPLGSAQKIFVKAFNSAPGVGIASCNSPSSDTIDVVTNNPVGDFVAQFTSIPWGGLALFTSSITGASNYNWSFGDGGISAQASPGHYYYDTGYKTVRLVARSVGGCLLTINKPLYILVGPKPVDSVDTQLPIRPINPNNPLEINLFPNPYGSKLFVTFTLKTASNNITVTAFTQKGELVATEKLLGAVGNNKIILKNFYSLSSQVIYVFKVQVDNTVKYFKQTRVNQY